MGHDSGFGYFTQISYYHLEMCVTETSDGLTSTCLWKITLFFRIDHFDKNRIAGMQSGVNGSGGDDDSENDNNNSNNDDDKSWWQKCSHRLSSQMLMHYCDVIMSAMASQITSLTIVCPTVYSGADQRKYQSPASLAFVWEIPRGPVNSPHKWPVTRKMFPFDDVIMEWLNKWIHKQWKQK